MLHKLLHILHVLLSSVAITPGSYILVEINDKTVIQGVEVTYLTSSKS